MGAVRTTAAASADLADIADWTSNWFGAAQTATYRDTISAAIEGLIDGLSTVGLKAKPEIGEGIYALHVARHGAKGRHFLLCRADETTAPPTMVVLRVLHDAMDLRRHVES